MPRYGNRVRTEWGGHRKYFGVINMFQIFIIAVITDVNTFSMIITWAYTLKWVYFLYVNCTLIKLIFKISQFNEKNICTSNTPNTNILYMVIEEILIINFRSYVI